jgi:hypothetical protein
MITVRQFPAPDTLITNDQEVVIEVLSTVRIQRVIIAMYYPGMGYSEVAYDGFDFAEFYELRSSLEEYLPEDPILGGGWRFHILRKRLGVNGWPDSPQPQVWAYEPATEGILPDPYEPTPYPLLSAYPYLP